MLARYSSWVLKFAGTTKFGSKMSFFKSVYVRYTYFATQLIDLDDDNTSNTLNSYDQTMMMSFRVPRNADLLKDVYILASFCFLNSLSFSALIATQAFILAVASLC
jgi:flagellar biosynthesis regulator FlbT